MDDHVLVEMTDQNEGMAQNSQAAVVVEEKAHSDSLYQNEMDRELAGLEQELE